MPQQQAQQIIATPWSYSYKSNNQKTKNNNNKQTNKQEEVRIYSSRKKKNEEKTNLELLFSSKLLFCSVLFCSVLLSSIFFSFFYCILFVFLLFFCRRNWWQSKNPKNSKAVVVSVNRRPWNSNALSFSFSPHHKTTGNWILEALEEAPSTERANGAWKTFLSEKNQKRRRRKKLEWRWRWRWFSSSSSSSSSSRVWKMQGISFMANS